MLRGVDIVYQHLFFSTFLVQHVYLYVFVVPRLHRAANVFVVRYLYICRVAAFCRDFSDKERRYRRVENGRDKKCQSPAVVEQIVVQNGGNGIAVAAHQVDSDCVLRLYMVLFAKRIHL